MSYRPGDSALRGLKKVLTTEYSVLPRQRGTLGWWLGSHQIHGGALWDVSPCNLIEIR